jgi:hypothetical protein
MTSALNSFIGSGFDKSAPVIGTDSITLGTVTLSGVWSGVSGSNEGEDGGLQFNVNASVIAKSATGIDLDLVGKTGTIKGVRVRCENLDIGEVLTTVYFSHATDL